MDPGCHRGGKGPTPKNVVSMTLYGTLSFTTFLDFSGRKQRKVCIHSLLCAFVSQYSNKIDFVSMGEAQMGSELGTPCLPLEPPVAGLTVRRF